MIGVPAGLAWEEPGKRIPPANFSATLGLRLDLYNRCHVQVHSVVAPSSGSDSYQPLDAGAT